MAQLDRLTLERISTEMRGPHLIATLDHAPTKNALTDQLMNELNQLLDATAQDSACLLYTSPSPRDRG